MTSTVPSQHADFIQKACTFFSTDPRFEALLAGGSLVHGGFDEHSDIDLVVIVGEPHYREILGQRRQFAQSLGQLVAAFSGEHVGEPRLLICLFDDPLLHVDLKFVTMEDLDARIEIPRVLWARDESAVFERLELAKIEWPNNTPDWFEERAWIWMHYAITKAMRGELYEAIGMLGFFREQVLGPMLCRRAGLDQRGVRRLETHAADADSRLALTVAGHSSAAVRQAIHASMALYLDLRQDQPPDAAAAGMPAALETLYPKHAANC